MGCSQSLAVRPPHPWLRGSGGMYNRLTSMIPLGTAQTRPARQRACPSDAACILSASSAHALEIAGLAALARFQFYWLEPKPHGPLASDAAGSARCCLHGLKRGIGDSGG